MKSMSDRLQRIILPVLLVLLLGLTASAVDVTGKWTGTGELRLGNGDVRKTTVYMDLRQDGQDVTGNAGPGPDQVLPISKGRIDGDKLTFEVVAPPESSGDGLVIFDATVSGDKMESTVKCQRFTGTLSLKR